MTLPDRLEINGITYVREAVDPVDPVEGDGPIRQRTIKVGSVEVLELFAANSERIYTHAASGACESFVGDKIAIHLSGKWYLHDIATGKSLLIGRRDIAGNANAYVPFSPNDELFFWVHGDALEVRRVGTGDEIGRHELSKRMQWRTTATSGDDVQFLLGSIDGNQHIAPYDGKTSELMGSGFWLRNVSPWNKVHNVWSGLGGVVFSPKSDDEQHLVYWIGYDGRGLVQLEPGEEGSRNEHSHQDFSGEFKIYGKAGEPESGSIQILRYPDGKPLQYDDDRIDAIYSGTQAKLREVMGTNEYLSFHHVHMVENEAVVSVITRADSDGIRKHGIIGVKVDGTSVTLSKLVSLHRSNVRKGDFHGTARPTLNRYRTKTGRRFAWHDGSGTVRVSEMK